MLSRVVTSAQAKSKVQQKISSAASKRLMKRAQKGDTQLVITNIDDLKAGRSISFWNETQKWSFRYLGGCFHWCFHISSRPGVYNISQQIDFQQKVYPKSTSQVAWRSLFLSNCSSQVGEEVMLNKEKIKIQEIAISVTLSTGLATACKSGDVVQLGESSGSLSKDVAEGEKELLVLKMPQLKKGDVLKVGANEKVTATCLQKVRKKRFLIWES